jgi:hypothetical protein
VGHAPSVPREPYRRGTLALAGETWSGSDGTRTRDLRRDRPVLVVPASSGVGGDLRPQQVFRSVGLRGFPATRRSFRRRPAGSARDEPLPYWKTDAMQSLFHSTDRSCKSGRLELRSSMPSDEEAVRRPPPSALRMRGGNRPRGYTVEASATPQPWLSWPRSTKT